MSYMQARAVKPDQSSYASLPDFTAATPEKARNPASFAFPPRLPSESMGTDQK
jgi:hypothetical protein